MGTLTNILGTPAATVRLGVTMEPTFQVSNTIRGELTVWALDPNYRPVIDFARGAKSAASFDEMKQAYVGAGGIMGGINTNSLGAKRAQKDLEQLARHGIDVRRVSFREVLTLSEFSESAMRIGLSKRTFEKAKERGLTNKEAIIESAYAARDITDYGRHGSKMAAAQRLVTFLNAHLQGADKFTRTIGGAGAYQKALSLLHRDNRGKSLSEREKQDLKTARGLMLKMSLIGLVGVGLSVLYQDDPEYEEFSEYLRASHWMVKTPGDRWLAVPKPFQEAILSNIFERAYEVHYYEDPEAMERMKRGLLQLMGPPMIAIILRPGIEHFSNKSLYNGMPLIARRLEGLEPDQQYSAWTSSFAKSLGKQLGVSPILIDHYITSYTGTVGRTVLDVTTAGDPKAPERGLDDMFFFRRFVRDPTRGSVSNQDFYKQMAKDGGELDAKYRTFSTFAANDQNREAQVYLGKMSDKEAAYVMARFTGKLNPSQSQRKFHPMERASDVARKVYALRRDVRDSDTLSATQRRLLDDALSEKVVMEYRNSMVAAGVRGYAKRKMMSLDDNMAEIEKISMPTADALKSMTRKIPPAEAVYEYYPEFERNMLEFRDILLNERTDLDGDMSNIIDALSE